MARHEISTEFVREAVKLAQQNGAASLTWTIRGDLVSSAAFTIEAGGVARFYVQETDGENPAVIIEGEGRIEDELLVLRDSAYEAFAVFCEALCLPGVERSGPDERT